MHFRDIRPSSHTELQLVPITTTTRLFHHKFISPSTQPASPTLSYSFFPTTSLADFNSHTPSLIA